jgi:hypothetical protein
MVTGMVLSWEPAETTTDSLESPAMLGLVIVTSAVAVWPAGIVTVLGLIEDAGVYAVVVAAH